MSEDQNGPTIETTCEGVRDLLYLLACDELEPEERDVVLAHLTTCAKCRVAAAEHEALSHSLPTGFVNRKLYYYSKHN